MDRGDLWMITFKEAGAYIDSKTPFTGKRMFAFDFTGMYVVYYHSTQWPLFIYDKQINQWFGLNNDGLSNTARTYYKRLHPANVSPIILDMPIMRKLMFSASYTTLIMNRLYA
jgi:hypothetical protein